MFSGIMLHMNQPSMSNAGMPGPQQKLSIKDTEEVVCEKCNHNVFQLGIYLRKISPLLTRDGKPAYHPIEGVAFYCVKCGHVNDSFIPPELKPKKLIV